MKTTCKSGFAAAISLMRGASAWQCGHHEAKKTIRVGLPRIFALVRVEPSFAVTLKSGAVAPATGEATGGGRTIVEASCAPRFSTTTRTTTNTATTIDAPEIISVHGVFLTGFVTEPRRAGGSCLRVVRCVALPAVFGRASVASDRRVV